MHYVNFMEIVEFTNSKVDRLLFSKNVLHRRFGTHRNERVDPSSRVDLLRYQEDRTIEEDARRMLRVLFPTLVYLRVIDNSLFVSSINMS